jgi:hypothetical protein
MSAPLRLPTFARSSVPASYIYLDADVTVPRRAGREVFSLR